MDWNIFWSAFGAIGTTLGSLITAIAVVIAVKQYKQPLKKMVKVEFSPAITSYLGSRLDFYCVNVQNIGIRQVQIESIYIKGNKKVLWLNNAQFPVSDIKHFPVQINPEEKKNFLFESKHFSEELKKAVEDGSIKKNKRLIIFVTDSLGDDYYCKTHMKIKDIIKNY